MGDNFPENAQVDMHDIATMILDAHWRLDTRLSQSQLMEILHADTQPQTCQAIPEEWYLHSSPNKVGYILRYPTTSEPNAKPLSVNEFIHPDGVVKPFAHGLTRKEIEDVYWRCKFYDNGYLLTYVAQQVLLLLPPSTTVHARTSTGFQISFKPRADTITVNEFPTTPKKPCMIFDYCMQPEVSPTAISRVVHLTGFQDATPWVYLFLGPATSENMYEDQRVILDFGTGAFGGRGGGGELFSLEKGVHFHDKVLHLVAHELEGDMKLSQVIQLSDPVMKKQGDDMVSMILERLKYIAADGEDDYCRYCGKAGVETRCSKCKKARFCKECHTLGWKYHKKWCY